MSGLKLAVIGNEYYKSLNELANAESEDDNFFQKALTFDTSNSGQEFIPTKWSADIIRQVFERSWHRQIIPSLTMTSLKMDIPSFTSRWSTKYLGASITSTDPANQISVQNTANSTSYQEIELKTLTINLMVDNKFLAYAASDQVEQILREDMISAVMEAEINAIINGDDSATHQDSNVTDADDVRKAFKGLRKLASATGVDVGNVEFTDTHFSKLIKSLGRYAQGKKNRCVAVGSSAVADSLRRNVDATKTWDKYQNDATIFKGEIPPIYGVQFIESNYVWENLNASGVYDGVTTDRTICVMFNADEVFLGVPKMLDRALSIKKWDDPRFDRKQLILIEDLGFQARHTDAIAVAYNAAITASSSS